MSHRYPTRYQKAQADSVPSYQTDTMSDEERQQELPSHRQHQESLFSSLIPYEMRREVEIILLDHYDEKIHLTHQEKKEGEQIYQLIQELTNERSTIKFMTLHYPIISRLHANIELFSYMKHNHELVRRFHHLAKTFHEYYDHFSVLYRSLWSQYMNPSSAAYKDIYLPYCTLLCTIKDIIQKGEMIFINEGLLNNY